MRGGGGLLEILGEKILNYWKIIQTGLWNSDLDQSLWLRYARDILEICLRYACVMPELCWTYASEICLICPRYA